MTRFLIPTLCLLSLAPALNGQEEKEVRSPELKAARKAYEDDRAKSIDAANARYVQKLRRLKEMAAGRNYELVKVIDAEIASLTFTKSLVETKWLWLAKPNDKPAKLRFMADGVIDQQYFKGTWSVIAPWTIAMRLDHDGRIGYLVFDAEMQGFTGRDFDGSDKLSGKRDE